ncbi:hypothetical protein BaRGS_00017089 [Batillaria attramentaria]|uniref:C17orf113 probable zinc finger domain-containing protein n=1 Tax=Batillaria attramentaria TaxID=370345 RepID=A0ABD0KWE5_9CAEN
MYDNGAMFCTICLDGKVSKNSFTAGCKNFRKSAITDRALTADHQLALKVPQHQQVCEEIVMTKQERGITTTVRTAHIHVAEVQSTILYNTAQHGKDSLNLHSTW